MAIYFLNPVLGVLVKTVRYETEVRTKIRVSMRPIFPTITETT